MIAVLKPDTSEEQKDNLIEWLKAQNVDVHISKGKEYTVLGLVGNTEAIDVELLESLSIVNSVKRVSEPFKKSNRKFHPENTLINVGDACFGDGSCVIIAGPCSVESEEQLVSLAKAVKAAGAKVLRADPFRKYFSPYENVDKLTDNIKLLSIAKKETGLPTASEIVNPDHIERYEDVDIIEVGTRNMQNYELLRELGKINKPVILRRGLASSLRELLMSAEHIMAGGNEQVILCERGTRTFETYTKNTLDISAIPMLHELSHLPVIADPGSASGKSSLVAPLSMAAVAGGADGIVIDVHEDPLKASYNGAQALTPQQFVELTAKLNKIREVM